MNSNHILCFVQPDGVLALGRHRYWSPQTPKLANKLVTVVRERPGTWRVYVLAGKGKSIQANLLVDPQFSDTKRARQLHDQLAKHRKNIGYVPPPPLIVQGVELTGRERAEFLDTAAKAAGIDLSRRASIVRGQATLLVELVEDAIEQSRLQHRSAVPAILRQAGERVVEMFGISGQRRIERQCRRDLERAQRREALLTLAQHIFDLPYVLSGHDQPLPSVDDGKDASAPNEDGHRLSGASK